MLILVSLRLESSQDDDDDASSMLRPTPDEVARATTDRKRRALHTWYQRVRELVEYRDAHDGSCHVPQRVAPLGTWCNKQREEYKAYRRREISKKEGGGGRQPRGGGGGGAGTTAAGTTAAGTSMTARRVAVLEHVGFQWAKPKGEASWKSHYEELKLIKKNHGTIRVPLRLGAGRGRGAASAADLAATDFGMEVKPLGRWITEQRRQKGLLDAGMASRLTSERVRMLTELGFDWGQPRPRQAAASRRCRRAPPTPPRRCASRPRRRGAAETASPEPAKSA